MTQSTAVQQRPQTRYRVRIACELSLRGEMVHAATRNVSRGGAAVRCAQALSPGETITVHLFVTEDGIEDPHGAALECTASVRWCNEDGKQHVAGLQFISLSDEQKAILADFLSRTR